MRCIVGAARAGARAVRGRCRGLSMVPPCSLARAAGAARGRRAGTAGNGTGTRAPPFLPASALLRAGALEPTWAPPRGHRDPWRCVHLFCFFFCRSLGCPRAPGTRPVTCSTAHAWVRPPKPSAQMGKQAQRGEAAYLSHSSKASRDTSTGPGENPSAGTEGPPCPTFHLADEKTEARRGYMSCARSKLAQSPVDRVSGAGLDVIDSTLPLNESFIHSANIGCLLCAQPDSLL